MLSNERFALECLQRYAESGDIVDASNGQFAHCPQPERYGDSGHYLLWGHHQHQGLLQSRDIGECCFFSGDALKWLKTVDYWPDNYFELWDVYDEYVSKNGSKAGKKGGKASWESMTPEQRSERARKGTASMTPQQRSENARKAAKSLYASLTPQQRSKRAGKAGLTLFEDPDHPELGHHNSGNLVQMQRARGYPYGPENRVKIE